MKIKNIILGTVLTLIPYNIKENNELYKKQVFVNFKNGGYVSKYKTNIFPTADIFAQGNKFKEEKFRQKLLREHGEYLTKDLIFVKRQNKQRTIENPFPRNIDPIKLDLKPENLREDEWKVFLHLRAESNKYWDKYYSKDLLDDAITIQQLKDINKGIYVIINPNIKDFEHNDSIIKNPQVMIIIDEMKREIIKIPVSIGKYGTGSPQTGYTPEGDFAINTYFPVITAWGDGLSSEGSYLDAVHSWVNSKGNGAYLLNKDFYERQGATMVKGIITIGPSLEHSGEPDSYENISWKQGIFIHGSNALTTRKFGKNASNGCIRIHPKHLKILQDKLVFGKAYRQIDGKRIRIKKGDTNVSNQQNNKVLFEKTQRHDQEYFFTAGSLLHIMKQKNFF